MANTYAKEITGVWIQPTYNEGDLSLVNVVTRVDYIITGTSGTTDATATEGPITFNPDAPTTAEGYITFEDLTAANVESWIPALTEEQESYYHGEIDRLISLQETPTEQWAELPWNIPPSPAE